MTKDNKTLFLVCKSPRTYLLVRRDLTDEQKEQKRKKYLDEKGKLRVDTTRASIGI